MNRPARITSVEHLGGRLLRLVFTDGLVRELDFEGALPGILAEVDSDEVFPTARVDPLAGTLTWATGADFDPDVLHGEVPSTSPHRPRLVSEYRLQETS